MEVIVDNESFKGVTSSETSPAVSSRGRTSALVSEEQRAMTESVEASLMLEEEMRRKWRRREGFGSKNAGLWL